MGVEDAVEEERSREVALALLEAALEPPDEDEEGGPEEVRKEDQMSLSVGIDLTLPAKRTCNYLHRVTAQQSCMLKVTTLASYLFPIIDYSNLIYYPASFVVLLGEVPPHQVL